MYKIFFFLLLFSISACSRQQSDQKVEELEKKIEELEAQVEAYNKNPNRSAVASDNDQPDQKSSDLILPTSEDLHKGRSIDVDILSLDSKTDANFTTHHILTVKNNYSKTIQSVRVGTKQWRRNTSLPERQLTETVSVSIPPGAQAELTITNSKWGDESLEVLYRMVLEIDAVTFTDGTVKWSSPPINGY